MTQISIEMLQKRVLLSRPLYLDGSAGDDVITVSDGPDVGSVVVGGVPGMKDGTIVRDVERLVVRAGDGDDRVTVNGLRNIEVDLHDDAGDDVLYGSRGATMFYGGAGHDRIFGRGAQNGIDFKRSPNGVTVRLDLDRVTDDGHGSSDLVKRIHWVLGSYHDDVIQLGSKDGLIKLENWQGGAGQGGDDRIIATKYGNALAGGAGNDTLLGGDGRDELEGGEGNDSLVGGAKVDIIRFGGSTGIVVRMDLGLVIQDGHDGQDVFSEIEGVNGTQFIDSIIGSNRGDHIFSGGGRDYIDGGGGNDHIIAVDKTCVEAKLFGGAGDDVVRLWSKFTGVYDGGEGLDRAYKGWTDELIAEG